MHELFFRAPKGRLLYHPGPFWDLVVEFIESGQREGMKKITCRTKLRNLTFFLDWLHRHGVTEAEHLERRHITEFEGLIAGMNASDSINMYTGGVMAMMPSVMDFLKWLYWRGVHVEPAVDAAYYNKRRDTHPKLSRSVTPGARTVCRSFRPRAYAPAAFRAVEQKMAEYLSKIRGVSERWCPSGKRA